jgi:LmbE family N-acetylglucosaminyl deacetylase
MSSIHKNTSVYDAVFLSPHLDDAVLSCGLQIIDLINRGKSVLVVTFFTRGSNLLSPDITLFVKDSGATSAEQLFLDRVQEDKKVMKLLSADPQHFSFCDALFRTHPKEPHALLYGTYQKVFSGKIHSLDSELLSTLTGTISEIMSHSAKTSTLFYAPLGVGGHVDHLLIHQAAKAAQLSKMRFWEDVPYQTEAPRVIHRLSQLSAGGESFLKKTIFNSQNAALKQKAVSLYRSQVEGLKVAGLGTINYHTEAYYQLVAQ